LLQKPVRFCVGKFKEWCSLMRVRMVLLAIVALLMMPEAAWAEDCEKIQSPFAYNECLARSAPPVASKVTRGEAVSDPESTVKERPRRSKRYATRARNPAGVNISRRSSRRVSATIDPWASTRTSAKKRR
jgi:hypothetical protein